MSLGATIATYLDQGFYNSTGYHPLQQDNPSYFQEFCDAIAAGITSEITSATFTTADTGFRGSPNSPGLGIGIGIIVDVNWFAQDLYTQIRNMTISQFEETIYPAYSSGVSNPLKSYTQALSEAISAFLSVGIQLSSTHSVVYAGSGVISQGNFSGLSVSSLGSSIASAASRFQGAGWNNYSNTLAASIVDAIHNHSTGSVTITGICFPSQSQSCGIPATSSGSGTVTIS